MFPIQAANNLHVGSYSFIHVLSSFNRNRIARSGPGVVMRPGKKRDRTNRVPALLGLTAQLVETEIY